MPRPNESIVIELSMHRRLQDLRAAAAAGAVPYLIHHISAARAQHCSATAGTQRAEAEARIRDLLNGLAQTAEALWTKPRCGPDDIVAMAHLVTFYCGPIVGDEPEDRAISSLVHAVTNQPGAKNDWTIYGQL